MTLFRRFRAAFAAAGTGAVLLAGVAVASPAHAADVLPRPAARGALVPSAPSAVTPSTPSGVVPSTCGVGMHRIAGGVLSRITVAGESFSQKTLGTFELAQVPEQPVALAYTGSSPTNPNVNYFHAAIKSGALWRITQTEGSSTFVIDEIRPTGFSGVKSMVMASSGQLYVVYNTGTFARYRLDSAGRIVGSALVGAAPSWKFARSLGWMPGGTFQGAPADSLLVVTESGNLNQYIINLSTRRVSGFNLKTGWNAYAHVTSGGCDTGNAAPIYGVTTSGNGYLWYDRDNFNLSGADLGPVGLRGTGLRGLLVD